MAKRGITLLLVDALNLIRRVYAAQPGDDGPERVEAARVASAQSLARALRLTAPTHAVCVFDGGGPSWRHRLHPGYKAGHTPMPEPLADGLAGFRDAFGREGVASLDRPGFEADDVIATLAAKCSAAGAAAIVLSTDRAYLELLPLGVRLRDHFRDEELGRDYVAERYGVAAERLTDLLALAGDHGNGIPGVPGIGVKKGAELLARYGDLEGLLAAAAEVPGKLGESLRAHVDDARLSRRLVALSTDLDVGVNLSELRVSRPLPEEPPGF